MNFKHFFENTCLLNEIAQVYIDFLKTANTKLPWDDIFGDKLRIKIDYTPDYSFLNTDEINYNTDKKAFFKKSDERQKNKLRISKPIDHHMVELNKLKEQFRERMVKTFEDFLANPKYKDEMAEMMRLTYVYPEDMIKSLRENGLVSTFSAYINNVKFREILLYIMPDYYELTNREYNIMHDLKGYKELKNSPERYTLVLSRAPIDVIRASDFNHIQSCMSSGGMHFDDLCMNAKAGSGIVYILPELNLSEEELQKPEIFKDMERNVDGVIPMARLQIRNYINTHTKQELMVPELRIFGSSISHKIKGVIYKEISKIIKDMQKIDTRFDESEWELQGGKYIDNEISAHELLRKFLQN